MHINRQTATIWTIVLLAVGFASNLFLICGSNLVAFAVVAALTLGLRRGSLVALGIWLESQVLGIVVFGYPHASMTVAWGIALGAATVLAAAIGSACASRGSVIAFAGAFAGYEIAIAAFAFASGSGLSAFTPLIIGQLLVSNTALAAGGIALYRLLMLAEPRIIRSFARRRRT